MLFQLSVDTYFLHSSILLKGENSMKRYSSIAYVGGHHQFKQNTKKGRVTLRHPVKDLSLNDVKSIEKQSGLSFT